MTRHLFVMDGISSMKPWKDTSYFLMLAAQQIGHSVSHCEFEDLYFNESLKAKAKSLQLTAYQEGMAQEDVISASSQSESEVDDFDYIWVRKDPPFDASYLYLTQLLDTLKKAKVINSPQSLRDWNEKLAILPYLKFSPQSFVANSTKQAVDHVKAEAKRFVFKPLDGFGGRGIHFFSSDDKDLETKVSQYFDEHGPSVMIQEYLKEAKDGDKRVLIWNGRLLGAILRLHADSSEINNLDAGGQALPSNLSEKEMACVQAILPDLVEKQLYFVGLDFIGEKLTEINVTSPTGLQELCRFEEKDYHIEIMQSLP